MQQTSVLPLYPDAEPRKSQTYPTFWNLFSKLSQTYLIFCTWIHRSCNDKCDRKYVIHKVKLTREGEACLMKDLTQPSLLLVDSYNSQSTRGIFKPWSNKHLHNFYLAKTYHNNAVLKSLTFNSGFSMAWFMTEWWSATRSSSGFLLIGNLSVDK